MESRNITCAIVGDSKVGKTCLISSYLKTGFRSEHISTDFFVAHRSTTQIEETSFKLTLWDSPGEKDCYRHVPASYPQTDVLLMCFSIDCRASFDHLRKKWDKEVRRNCPKAPKILVGTKLDLRSGGAYDTDFISKLEGLDLCGVIGAYRYIECSARTEENVKDVFDEAIFATLGRQTKVQEKKSKSPFPNLKPKKWKKNRSAGCERKMSSSKENIAAIDRRCVDQGIEPEYKTHDQPGLRESTPHINRFGYTKPDVNLVAEGSDEYDVYNEIEVASTYRYIEPFQPPPQPVIPSALQSLAQSISTRPLQDAESNDQAARQYENLYQYLPANIVDRPPLPKRLAQITSAPDMVAYGAPDHILAERPSDVRTAGASPCSASAPVSNSQTTENPTESGTCQQETIEAATLSQDSSRQEMSFEKSYSVQSKSGQSGDVSEIPEAIAQNLEASEVVQSEESAVPGKIEAQPTLTAAKSEGSRNSETISVESVMDQSASEDSDCIISDPEPIVSFRIPASVAKDSVLTLKAVLLGDPAVGKTCLLTAFTEGQCPLDYVPTEADECFTSEGTFGDSQLRLRLWDVSCTQLFDTCRPLRYRQITVFILCFSITCPASFENVRTKWCSEVRRHSPDAPIVLVGTKLDLRDDQETLDKLKETGLSPISEPQGKATAKEIGAARYLECSALSQKGIVDVFKEAVLAAVSPSSVALKAHLPAEL